MLKASTEKLYCFSEKTINIICNSTLEMVTSLDIIDNIEEKYFTSGMILGN